MNTTRREFVKAGLVTGIGMGLGFPAYLRHAWAADPIKIGLPAALSGGNAQYGDPGQARVRAVRQGHQGQGRHPRTARRVHLRGHRGRSRHRGEEGAEAGGEGRRQVPDRRRALLGGPRRLRQVPRVEGHLHVHHQRGGRAHREELEPLLLPREHQRPHGRAGGEPLPGRVADEALLRAGQRLRVGTRQRRLLREADHGARARRSSARTFRRSARRTSPATSPRSSSRGPQGCYLVLRGPGRHHLLQAGLPVRPHPRGEADHGDPGAGEHEGRRRRDGRRHRQLALSVHGGHAEEPRLREALPRDARGLPGHVRRRDLRGPRVARAGHQKAGTRRRREGDRGLGGLAVRGARGALLHAQVRSPGRAARDSWSRRRRIRSTRTSSRRSSRRTPGTR